jgi:restriction system protein
MRHGTFGSHLRRLAYAALRAERANKRIRSRSVFVERHDYLSDDSHLLRQPANGVAFEHAVARQLNDLGWQTRLTASTGDFGADIIATCLSEKLVVQCKDWRGPAGISSVQEVSYAKTHYNAHIAAVIVSRGFTKSAYTGAANANVFLLNYNSLPGSPLDRRQHQKPRDNHNTPPNYNYTIGFSLPRVSQETKDKAARLNEEYYHANIEKSKEWQRYDRAWGFNVSPPNFPRRSAFRLCIECQSVLTLDWGKKSQIICDVCKHLNKFQT